MKRTVFTFLFLILLFPNLVAQSTDIPSTIEYINKVIKENTRYFGYQSNPNDHFKSKKYDQRCFSDYYDRISLSSDGNFTIIRTITFRDCTDPIDNENFYTSDVQNFHHEDISRGLTSLKDVTIVLKAKNSKKIFSYFEATSEYKLWEFRNSYDAERCFNAFSHLLRLLDNDSRYARNDNDPFAPDNYKISQSPKTVEHVSSKYNYSISAPPNFKESASDRTNIDTKLVDLATGASIIIHVSKRLPEEIGMTGHSYSADYFKTIYKNEGYNIIVLKEDKTTVAGQPAFKMVLDHPVDNRLRVLEYSFFKGSYAFVLTCTSEKSSFNTYEEIFRQAAISMKFY